MTHISWFHFVHCQLISKSSRNYQHTSGININILESRRSCNDGSFMESRGSCNRVSCNYGNWNLPISNLEYSVMVKLIEMVVPSVLSGKNFVQKISTILKKYFRNFPSENISIQNFFHGENIKIPKITSSHLWTVLK